MQLKTGLLCGFVALAAVPAFAEEPNGDDKAPRFLIVRVAAADGVVDSTGQQAEDQAEVFPISMQLDREADGTVDKEKVRQKIVQALQDTTPVVIGGDSVDLDTLPDQLRQEFQRAEKETEDEGETERVVAWRHYGPVTGYSAGIVAHGRAPYYGYRGYYPRELVGYVPYYGYYTRGQVYNYAYGAYRRTPSYHYYGYYRHY